MSLSKTLFSLFSTGTTQEDRNLSRHDRKIIDWDVRLKQTYVVGTQKNRLTVSLTVLLSTQNECFQ